MKFSKHILALLVLCLPSGIALAGSLEVDLLEPANENLGWIFHEGREFPGARGGLEIQKGTAGAQILKITGDFNDGGQYVSAKSAAIAEYDPASVHLSFRSPDADRLVLRLVDAAERCHQFVLTIDKSPDEQEIVFNLPAFFEGGDLGVKVAQYEGWGGDQPRSGKENAKWSPPAKSLAIILNKRPDQSVRELWLSKAKVTLRE